jgi:hypothetical protein
MSGKVEVHIHDRPTLKLVYLLAKLNIVNKEIEAIWGDRNTQFFMRVNTSIEILNEQIKITDMLDSLSRLADIYDGGYGK